MHKKILSIFLLLSLFLSSIYTGPRVRAAQQEVTIHHIRLDMAVVFAWSDGKSGWAKNIKPGKNFKSQNLIDIGVGMKNVKVSKFHEVIFPLIGQRIPIPLSSIEIQQMFATVGVNILQTICPIQQLSIK